MAFDKMTYLYPGLLATIDRSELNHQQLEVIMGLPAEMQEAEAEKARVLNRAKAVKRALNGVPTAFGVKLYYRKNRKTQKVSKIPTGVIVEDPAFGRRGQFYTLKAWQRAQAFTATETASIVAALAKLPVVEAADDGDDE
jgi:hypothetical protein